MKKKVQSIFMAMLLLLGTLPLMAPSCAGGSSSTGGMTGAGGGDCGRQGCSGTDPFPAYLNGPTWPSFTGSQVLLGGSTVWGFAASGMGQQIFSEDPGEFMALGDAFDWAQLESLEGFYVGQMFSLGGSTYEITSAVVFSVDLEAGALTVVVDAIPTDASVELAIAGGYAIFEWVSLFIDLAPLLLLQKDFPFKYATFVPSQDAGSVMKAAVGSCADVSCNNGATYNGFYAMGSPTCNDPKGRVVRGLALFRGNNPIAPAFEAVPVLGYLAQGWGNPVYITPPTFTTPANPPGFTQVYNFNVKFLKNGNAWSGNAKTFKTNPLKPTDNLQIVETYNGGFTTGAHKLVVGNFNSPKGPVCINADGTSCGVTFTLDGQKICY